MLCSTVFRKQCEKFQENTFEEFLLSEKMQVNISTLFKEDFVLGAFLIILQSTLV